MSKLIFKPVRFTEPFKAIAPVEAWEALAASRLDLSNLGNFAEPAELTHSPRAIELAIAGEDIRGAIRSGQLPAYVYKETTAEFFTIPRDYWADDLFVDCFVGRVFALTAEELVPPALDGELIVLLEHEWTPWLQKIRASDAQWMTINQAERVLKQFPLNRRAHLHCLFDALESGAVRSTARLPAPPNSNLTRQGRIDPTATWWRDYLAKHSAATPAWTSWFVDGGLAVSTSDVGKLLAQIRILGARFKSDKTRQQSDRSWDLLECWGWIATRNLKAVSEIGGWLDSGEPDPPTARTFAYCELRFIVSNDFCVCGKSGIDSGAEPWRNCNCTNNAWDALRDELVDGKIEAYRPDQETGVLRVVPPSAFLNAKHLPQLDSYEMLGGATDIVLDRNQVQSQWVEAAPGGREAGSCYPFLGLLDHYSKRAAREFSDRRDAVNDEFFLSGRGQSANHIRELIEAAQSSVERFSVDAWNFPQAALFHGLLMRKALALFDQLTVEVRVAAVGAAGKAPRAASGKIFDDLASTSRAWVAAQIGSWKLERQLTNETVCISGAVDQPNVATNHTKPTGTIAAQRECETWLRTAFKAEPISKTRNDYQAEAIKRAGGRLSARGFMRAWGNTAPEAGRSTPGRKS